MSIKSLSLLIIFLAGAVITGCERPELFSAWKNRELSVDAKYADWGSYTSHYDEKTKVVLNLANDADYLYICLITRNRAIETQIMESGLVAWFDPEAGQNRAFGIRFPTGLKAMGMSLEDKDRDMTKDWEDQLDKGELIDREKEKFKSRDFNQRLEALEGLQDRLEIMAEIPRGRANNKPTELSLDESKKLGIEAKVGRENDYFVYELKVPLLKSVTHPYAIGVKTDRVIGLGLEIAPVRPRLDNRGAPEDGDKGEGVPMTKRHRGDIFQLWARVTLSSGG